MAGRALVLTITLLACLPLASRGAGPTLAAASSSTATIPVAVHVTPDVLPKLRNLWGSCPAFPASPIRPSSAANSGPQITYISSEQLQSIQHGDSVFTGSVQLDQGDRRITAARMIYNEDTGLVQVKQQVQYITPKLILSGSAGEYDTNKTSGSFADADFLLPGRHGHGTAQTMISLDSNHSSLQDVHYTSCPVHQEDWYLDAGDMTLDMTTNAGIAHDVTVDFMGVPLFWSPYLNFPLSDARKSGLLAPQFGFSTSSGFDLSQPYYLDLADNYDATLTPRAITKRGLQLGGEFRYLDGSSTAQVDGNYLNHDQLADSERGLLSVQDDTHFNKSLDFNVAYNWVSDNNYFQDLGTDLAAISTTFLERHIRLSYDDAQNWSISTQFQDFQIVDPTMTIPITSYPYRRLPQTVFLWQNSGDVTGPQFALYGEMVRFQQDQLVGAWRSDVKPSIGDTFGGAGGYFTPTLAWRMTDYDLDQNLPNTMTATHLSRSLPIFSIDSGMYFDNDAGNYLETLEPRLYYLRVPYRDQSQIPVFDAVQPDFSFLQLFSDNRFYGADRQADANQLSYALTGRLLDPASGSELLQADLGQIRYFSPRLVQLDPATPPDTSLYSDVVTDVMLNMNKSWSVSYDQLWSPETRQNDLGTVMFGYHPDAEHILNLAYRFNRPTNVKQTDMSFDWPLSVNWSMVGRWNYDLLQHLTLEDFLGVEYDSCCWDLQLLHRHFVTATGHGDSVIFLELQLKGLATLGRHLEDFLQSGILGYPNTSSSTQPEQQTPQ
jgi:LPS-assembly protein